MPMTPDTGHGLRVNLMRSKSQCIYAAIVAFTAPTVASAGTLWSIYWLSNPQPCTGIMGGLQGPVVSSYYKPCQVRGVSVSICPGTVPFSGPWNSDAEIRVVGYQIVMILSSATVQGVMEVGSARTAPPDGADIFAATAGVGTNSKAGFFPDETGIPQGKMPDYAHFDVYAACDAGGQFQALVNIFYSSP